MTTNSGIVQDTENVIAFADTPDAVATVGSAIAVTVPFGFADGRITGTDIILNPKLTYTTTGQAGAYDLQSVITHELGHALGANHATSQSSTMFWATKQSSTGWSRLKPDDAAFVAETYPGPGAASVYGKIVGKALKAGAPISGAAVVAIDSGSGVTIGGLSGTDGTYSITVPVGNYQLYVAPVAPFTPAGAIYGFSASQIDADIVPASGASVQVTAGASVSADIATTPGASTFRITASGVSTPTNTSWGTTVLELASGQSIDLIVFGPGVDSSIAEQNIALIGPGISLHPGSLRGNSVQDSSGLSPIQFTVDIASRTTPASASLLIKRGNDAAFLSAGISILPPKPTFTAAGIVDAASATAGGVAPGELVTVYGVGVGPDSPVVNSGFDPTTGLLATTLGGMQVRFNGVLAPLLYVSAGQVNLQVPYEVAGSSSAAVTITNLGSAGDIVSLPVLTAHPGLFPAVLNQDGSLNSASNPAPAGSYVTLYGTGGGAVTPAVATGAPAPASPLSFAASAAVSIGGQDAVVYQGAVLSPTFVGLLQVAAQVPPAAAAGSAQVKLTIAGQTSAAITVWIR